MSDLIDRQAALEAICEHGTDLERRGITILAVATHKQVTVDLLENLPSAEPKKGKWIATGRKFEGGYFWIRCSECGYRDIDAPSSRTNFCPNCGADMRGEEE